MTIGSGIAIAAIWLAAAAMTYAIPAFGAVFVMGAFGGTYCVIGESCDE